MGRALGEFLAPDATLTAKEALDGLAQQLETVLDQFGRSAG